MSETTELASIVGEGIERLEVLTSTNRLKFHLEGSWDHVKSSEISAARKSVEDVVTMGVDAGIAPETAAKTKLDVMRIRILQELKSSLQSGQDTVSPVGAQRRDWRYGLRRTYEWARTIVPTA